MRKASPKEKIHDYIQIKSIYYCLPGDSFSFLTDQEAKLWTKHSGADYVCKTVCKMKKPILIGAFVHFKRFPDILISNELLEDMRRLADLYDYFKLTGADWQKAQKGAKYWT